MNKYFEKRTYLSHPLIKQSPKENLDLIVVIPAYKEKGMLDCLNDLFHKRCDDICTEVIVVINHREDDPSSIKEESKSQLEVLEQWSMTHNQTTFQCHPILIENMPKKDGGVGLARKIGMDEAAYRFDSMNKSGIVVAYDADCICSDHYFKGIYAHFLNYPKIAAASLYFEHPLEGLNDKEKSSIISYELHLRCYVNFKRWVGLPFAFQTIGSSMAVRSVDYIAKGGMNKRKAGEDFYFLQKFIEDRRFSEINNVTVYPSARGSDRVPFGTGRAVNALLVGDAEFTTYHPEAYKDFKPLIDDATRLFNISEIDLEGLVDSWPEPLKVFLKDQNFHGALKNVRTNSSNQNSFIKRFYHWMNAFRFMKYLHFYRDHYKGNVPCLEAFRQLPIETEESILNDEMGLKVLRAEDKGSLFWKSIE